LKMDKMADQQERTGTFHANEVAQQRRSFCRSAEAYTAYAQNHYDIDQFSYYPAASSRPYDYSYPPVERPTADPASPYSYPVALLTTNQASCYTSRGLNLKPLNDGIQALSCNGIQQQNEYTSIGAKASSEQPSQCQSNDHH